MLVNFCSTHYGHTPEEDVMHLRLPKDFKLAVFNKLLQGVTIDRILDDIRDSVDEGGLKRCHHSTKKDIQNIKRVCNVDGVQKHSNDYTSVAAWVEELKSMEFCPVIAFKPQGVSSEREGVKDNDFLLALQTQFRGGSRKNKRGGLARKGRSPVRGRQSRPGQQPRQRRIFCKI